MRIYCDKTAEDGTRRIELFGLRIYKKWHAGDLIKRTYLCGIIKTTVNNCRPRIKKKFYFCGIKFWTSDKDNPDYFVRELDNLRLFLSNRLDDIYYDMQVLSKVPFVHKYLLKYKNCNIGKDVILFAGGPTVKYYNNEIKQAKKCGVNGIFNYIDDLDYLFIEDLFLWDVSQNKLSDEYRGNNCEKFYGILPKRRLDILNFRRSFTDRIPCENIYNGSANVFLIEDVFGGNWATDIDIEPLGDFGGSVFSALQFIAYTNPKRIYLCGNDCSQAPNIYLEEDAKRSDHALKINSYILFKEFINRMYPSIEVISINPVGLRGIFDDVYTESFLDKNPEIMEDIGKNATILSKERELIL